MLTSILIAVFGVAAISASALFLLRQSKARKHLRMINESEARTGYETLRDAIRALQFREYVAQSMVKTWKETHPSALEFSLKPHLAKFLPDAEKQDYTAWCSQIANLPQTIREMNTRFVTQRLQEESVAFDHLERFPLTERQRIAIVTDEDTTLVVAGAGTGKTSTIVGKVDYLTRRGLAAPNEILVLAFAKKASEEIKQRIRALGQPNTNEVSTFHSLGYKIVSESRPKKASITRFADDDVELLRFISGCVRTLFADPENNMWLRSFFSSEADDEAERESQDKTGDEYIQHLKDREMRSLSGTKLKSWEEVRIANFLTLSGIRWEYERDYPVKTATRTRRQYKPDFYLPEADLYLEHFGINKHGKTAPHIRADEYIEGMHWKRQIHQKYGTKLIETYSYFKEQGGLIPNLERLLREHNVVPRQLTEEEIRKITDEGNPVFSSFVKLLAQFLRLYKSGGSDQERVRARAKSERDALFLEVFWKVFEEYQNKLGGEIDFEDMILQARDFARSGTYLSPFRYIIVDEFQDISLCRLELIQALLAQRDDARLFAVGDDWQSIYRFAGSDIGLFTNLHEHVGATERVDLDKTFRYSQALLNLTSEFVMRNPFQLRKTLSSHVQSRGNQSRPARVIFQDRQQDPLHSLDLAFEDIIVNAEGKGASVFIIGRYNRSKPTLSREINAKLKGNNITVEYLTAHASKGKEADFVVLIDLNAGIYGFPSLVADDPVVRMVLSETENYPYAEERRLFYVAMTRARKRVYTIAPSDEPSIFIRGDLIKGPLKESIEIVGDFTERLFCPKCQGQTIRKTQGQYGSFWACSNYPFCDGRLDTCLFCKSGALVPDTNPQGARTATCSECQRQIEQCPRCKDGYLVVRTGGFSGRFYGCTKWNGGNGCRYTRNIPESTVMETSGLQTPANRYPQHRQSAPQAFQWEEDSPPDVPF